MTTLTAFNDDVQKIFRTEKLNTNRKNDILQTIEEATHKIGKSFRKLFPNKKMLILDKITYMLSGAGVCTIGAEKLAEDADASLTTVYNTVRELKKTGAVLVARLQTNETNAGKYIFVLKSHPNFTNIMKEVFYVDASDLVAPEEAEKAEIEGQDVGQNEGQIVGQENAENVDTQGLEGEKSGLNYINGFNSFNSLKQAFNNNYIADAVEEDLREAKDERQELERFNTYMTNEYQKMVYNQIKLMGGIHEDIKKVASVIGLRVGSNATSQNAVKAMHTVLKLNQKVEAGEAIESLVGWFSAVYEGREPKAVTVAPIQEVQEEAPTRKVVPFYNWLVERE